MKPKGVPEHYVEIHRDCWVHPSLVGKEHRPVGGLLPTESKQDPLPALDSRKPPRTGGQKRVAVRVTLIRCSGKLLDSDNLVASYKGLRDSIAKSLAIDDGDPRIKWEYGQIETHSGKGSIVRIELA